MTLLRRLETALNKIYDGNIMTANVPDGESHKDQYKCDCGAIVSDENWSSNYKCCNECYMEILEDQKYKWGA